MSLQPLSDSISRLKCFLGSHPFFGAVMASRDDKAYVEISLYVKNGSREKFISRFSTSLTTTSMVKRDLLRDETIGWMQKNHKDVKNPDATRIFARFDYHGKDVDLSGYDVVKGNPHYKVVYDNSAVFEKPDSDDEAKACEANAMQNSDLIPVEITDPYTKKFANKMMASKTTPLSQVLHAIQSHSFDRKKHEKMGKNAPDRIVVSLPFTAPVQDDDAGNYVTFRREDVHRMFEEMVSTAREEAVRETLANVATETLRQPQSSVTAPSSNNAPSVGVFSGTGMKLCEIEENKVVQEPLPEQSAGSTDASSEELVVDDEQEKWEEEIVPLNEETANRPNVRYIKLAGKLIYKFYSSKVDRFESFGSSMLLG